MPETPNDYFPHEAYSTVQFNFIEEYEFAVREIEFPESRRRQASLLDSRPRRHLQAQMLLSVWETERKVRDFMVSHSGSFVPFWVFATQRRKFVDFQIGTGNGSNDTFWIPFYTESDDIGPLPGFPVLDHNLEILDVKVAGVPKTRPTNWGPGTALDNIIPIIFAAGSIPGNGAAVTTTLIGRPRIAVKWDGTVYHQEHPLRVPERRDYMAELVTLPLIEVF